MNGADARIAELEAQCAAMREAMGALVDLHEIVIENMKREHGEPPFPLVILADAKGALASDAGKALLERLRVAEAPRVTIGAAFAQTEQAIKVADMVQKTCDARVSRARAQAIEEAAKVSESYEPECESCPRGVANAIRNLNQPTKEGA